MPVGDLGVPATEGAAQAAQFWGSIDVGEIGEVSHTRRAGRPNAGKSTNRTAAEPLHTPPRRSPHSSAGAASAHATPRPRPPRRRRRGSPPRPDRPTTRRCVGFSSTRDLHFESVCVTPHSGGPHPRHHGPSARSNPKSQLARAVSDTAAQCGAACGSIRTMQRDDCMCTRNTAASDTLHGYLKRRGS